MVDYFRGLRLPTPFAENYLFYPNQMGHLKTDKPRQLDITRNNIPGNIILHVLSGQLHVIQEKHYVLTDGQTVLFRQRTQHAYYNEENCELLWMHFDGRQGELFLDYIERHCGFPYIFESEEIRPLLIECINLCNKYELSTEFQLSEVIYSLFQVAMRCAKNNCLSSTQDERAVFTSRALAYIQENIYNKITLADFAATFHLSPSYFSRLFKKYFDIAPLQYVLKEKLGYSKHFLVYTNHSLSQISATLNFVDQSHFTNLFKRYYGISPNQFRKNWQQHINI